jgi:membrane associated rhomboid family serine protease
MPRGYSTTLAFPPFTRAIKMLVIANTAVFLLMLMLRAAAPSAYEVILQFGWLLPFSVVHGAIWQVVTYSFLHAGLFHILFNMLTLWMFGAQLESDWGRNQFLEFYFFCVIAAALTTVAVAYAGTIPAIGFLGVTPTIPTVGASGGIFGVMIAFAVLYGDQQFMLFPFPFMIKAKYLVAILVLIALAGAFQGMGAGHRGESVAYFAHLGGALFGYLYLRLVPRRGLTYVASERYFGLRNGYYRWKRRRAARKFEVYMRQHGRDVYFDEYGNYRGPGTAPPPPDKKNGGGKSGWVN